MPHPTETYQVTKEQLYQIYVDGYYLASDSYPYKGDIETFVKECLEERNIKPIAKVDPVEVISNPHSPTSRWIVAHDLYKPPESIIESAGSGSVYNKQSEPPKLDLKEIERLYENREDLLITVSNFGGSICLNQDHIYVMRNTPEDHRQNLKYAPQKFK